MSLSFGFGHEEVPVYTSLMKHHEYIEGPEALENFKRGMIALFKVPKKAIGGRKKGRKLTAPRKRKRVDKD